MNNIKQLPRLLVFAVVAQKKSFTRASTHLGVSKSAVSQQVSQLEADIGAQLLSRTTRGVSLTALGEQLLERCSLLQDQVEQIFNDIIDDGTNPKGRFAITYPHSLETTVVLPAIEQLCIEYPELEPELIADDSTLDLVTNQLDLAIHAGELPDSSYRALPVGVLTEIFCASPLYLSQHDNLVAVDDLDKHRWIATGWQKPTMTVTHLETGWQDSITLRQFAKVSTLSTAVEMALRHLGIVLVPDVIASALIETGQLVHIVPDVTGPQWPVFAVHAYQQDKPIHVSRFHQLVSRYFAN